jgi:pimeloyl-ACP methyl ester carboxylesterase
MHCYDIAGTGELPETVLLHGLGASAAPFGSLMARLRPHVRRVLAPDQLGHGFSAGRAAALTPGALVEAMCQTLEPLLEAPALVVGNSLGGAVAVRYALACPEQVRGLVLVSPAGAPSLDREWSEIRETFDMRSRWDAALFLRRVYREPPWFLPLVAHELPATLGSVPVRSFLEAASNATALTPEELGALKVPVLLIWGESDLLLPRSHFRYFAEHLPSSTRIERPETFGHSPHVDAPDALAELLLPFAAQLVGSRP